jgi:transcriptional regulator with XRE-family HTH domain
MELVSIFTTNLRHYLKEHNQRGRTFMDICREAPFPKGTLGTLTAGRVDNPTYNTCYKLAQALWVPMEAFAATTKSDREKYCRDIRARHKNLCLYAELGIKTQIFRNKVR